MEKETYIQPCASVMEINEENGKGSPITSSSTAENEVVGDDDEDLFGD